MGKHGLPHPFRSGFPAVPSPTFPEHPMKHLLSSALLAATLAAGLATPAAAQSDILLRLRSGSPAGDRFRVDSAGGVVARGSLGIGIIPQTGAGERMMWYPFKASFRVGGVDGTQ